MAAEVVFVDQTLHTAALGRASLQAALGELKKLGLTMMDVPWKLGALRILETQARRLRAVVPAAAEAVAQAAAYGFQEVCISCELRRGLPEELAGALRQAAGLGLRATLLVRDASSLPAEFWPQAVPRWRACGLAALAYGDEEALLQPLVVGRHLAVLQQCWPELTLEFHASNRRQLASANLLAAWRAGVVRLATSLGGHGGHAPWEEALLSLRQFAALPLVVPAQLAQRCQWVLQLLGEDVPRNKAVIGDWIFAHESGLHVAGVAKEGKNYEAFEPEMVGLKRQIILGKHSGTASLRAKFRELGLPLGGQPEVLLQKIRDLAVAHKRALSDAEIVALCREVTAS